MARIEPIGEQHRHAHHLAGAAPRPARPRTPRTGGARGSRARSRPRRRCDRCAAGCNRAASRPRGPRRTSSLPRTRPIPRAARRSDRRLGPGRRSRARATARPRAPPPAPRRCPRARPSRSRPGARACSPHRRRPLLLAAHAVVHAPAAARDRAAAGLEDRLQVGPALGGQGADGEAHRGAGSRAGWGRREWIRRGEGLVAVAPGARSMQVLGQAVGDLVVVALVGDVDVDA